jgi:hypothetical protein
MEQVPRPRTALSDRHAPMPPVVPNEPQSFTAASDVG